MASPPSASSAHYMASSPSPYAPSVPVDHGLDWEDWQDIFIFGAGCLTLACYGWFSLLIGLDVWRAIRKRATWLPGKAFSLTGVTVQIIVWWTNVSRIINERKEEMDAEDLVAFHQLVVSGKVALCVFIGYSLPGMAAPSVRTFLALGISICIQIASELLILQKQNHEIDEEYRGWSIWMKIANSTLLICIIVLGLISVCTILGSQTVHSLLKQRTSAIFSIASEVEFKLSNERTLLISWNDFEEEVLSSWLVARVCRIDYVISRSVLSSAVCVVVTFCVIISLISNTFWNEFFHKPYYGTDYAIVFLLFSFIIIGWIVICWRWLAVQLYFRSHGQIWRRSLCLEDFWTRNTVELIHTYDLKKDRQRFSKMQRLPTKIFTKVRLHKLVYLLVMLQQSVVFFSKLCSFLSEVIIGNFVYWFRKQMRKGHPVEPPEKCKRILKLICMPGEDPSDLWEANEMSFNEVKRLMREGCKKGRSSVEINSNFHLYSVQWVEDGEQILNMLQTISFPSISKLFPSVEKLCVRITVVSLITIFSQLHKAKSTSLKKVLNDCQEVWDLLSFADECDIDLQANEISLFDDLSKNKDQVWMAAEREFYKLQVEYDKLSSHCEDCVIDVEEAREILKDLLKKCEGLLTTENLLGSEEEVAANLSDSKDWMEIAPKYNLYKVCKLMLGKDIEDFAVWTEDALKNVIACCVSRLPDMLVKQCRKWAQEFEEDKLWEAINLAGKLKAIMEACDLKPKLQMNTTIQRRHSI